MAALATRGIFLLALALALALALGCHTDSATAGDAGLSGDAVAGVMCTGPNGVFPAFDKTCTIADDCAMGIHQTNCCGATQAIGMTRAELTRFTAAEKVCVDQYPQCECPTTPTEAEDGHTPVGGQAIVVECQSRKCMTTVK